METLNEYLSSGQLSLSLIIPVVTVLVGAVLVFICGINKPKEPQFRKIAASVESSSKKTKRKEKQPSSTAAKVSVQNGSVKQSQSPASSASSKKQSTPASKKDKQSEEKSPKRKEVAVSKKTAAKTSAKATVKSSPKVKAVKAPKPADFDDDGWTTVPSRTDKKKKPDDAQTVDTTLSQSAKKSTGNNKANTKSTKNAKQLKDQVNKSKKEAAEINKKNKKNVTASDNGQVNNKVADTIENFANELKKKDAGEFVKQPKIVEAIDGGAAEEKSDDSKPVTGGGVAFNEMPDTWTEAKAPKKGKKKARKD